MFTTKANVLELQSVAGSLLKLFVHLKHQIITLAIINGKIKENKQSADGILSKEPES